MVSNHLPVTTPIQNMPITDTFTKGTVPTENSVNKTFYVQRKTFLIAFISIFALLEIILVSSYSALRFASEGSLTSFLLIAGLMQLLILIIPSVIFLQIPTKLEYTGGSLVVHRPVGKFTISKGSMIRINSDAKIPGMVMVTTGLLNQFNLPKATPQFEDIMTILNKLSSTSGA